MRIALEVGTGLLQMEEEIPGMKFPSGLLVFFSQPQVLVFLFPLYCHYSFLIGLLLLRLQEFLQNYLIAHPEPIMLPSFHNTYCSFKLR